MIAAATIAELLADVESTETLEMADGKSGVRMERVRIDGESYVVKYLSLADDWIMRITNDHSLRPLQVWESGLRERLPRCIDDATVAMGLDDPDGDRRTARLAILMRDVGEWLVPEGHDPIPLDQHRLFLTHMATPARDVLGMARRRRAVSNTRPLPLVRARAPDR